jgi:hypothetical protein
MNKQPDPLLTRGPGGKAGVPITPSAQGAGELQAGGPGTCSPRVRTRGKAPECPRPWTSTLSAWCVAFAQVNPSGPWMRLIRCHGCTREPRGIALSLDMRAKLSLQESRAARTKCLQALAETYALQCENHELRCDLREALRRLHELVSRAGATSVRATEAETAAAAVNRPTWPAATPWRAC